MSILTYLNPLYGPTILRKNKNLLFQMVKRTVSARYKGSVLGVFWSFAQPLLMLAVYTFVFGIVFNVRWGEENATEASPVPFPLIMFCGMAIFNIFAESVNACTSIVTANASYVKKVVFPLEILPVSTVFSGLIFGCAWFMLLLVGTAVWTHNIHWTVLLLPLILLPLLLFSLGIGFFMASLGVYLRDTQQVVAVITQVLFFMTPIFYPIAVVPEDLRWILEFNPLSPFVEDARRVVLFGELPDWMHYLQSFFLSCVIFQLGLAWFSKTKKGFADVL